MINPYPGDWTLADWGLAVFVACVALDVAGLVLDMVLIHDGQVSITEWVERVPVLGVPILALQVVLLVGLALHFYAR